jgi:hypothetical protein
MPLRNANYSAAIIALLRAQQRPARNKRQKAVSRQYVRWNAVQT